MLNKNKILIIASTKNQVVRAIPKIKELRKDTENEVIVLGFGSEAQNILNLEDIAYKKPGEYFKEDFNNEIWGRASSIARQWHAPDGNRKNEDFTVYKNISLGDVVELELSVLVYDVLTNLEIIRKVIEIEKPNHIIAIDDSYPMTEVAIFTGNLLGVPIEILNPPLLNLKYLYTKFVREFIILNIKPYVVRHLFRWTGYSRSFWKKTETETSIDLKSIRKSERKNILILSYMGHDVINLIPVIDELKKKKTNNLIVLGLSKEAQIALDSENISYRTLGDYIAKDVDKKTRIESILLKKKWSKIREDSKFRESFTYENLSIYEIIEEIFSLYLLARFVEIIRYYEVLERILYLENIHMIVVASDVHPLGKLVVKLGECEGVPSLVLQHGVTHYPYGYVPVSSTKIAAWGEISCEWLMKHGVPKEKIVLTGCPRFDPLALKTFIKTDVHKILQIEKSKEIIVLTTEPGWGLGKRSVPYTAINAMHYFPDKHLVIKLHPDDEGEIYEEIKKEVGPENITIVRDIDLNSLLDESIVLVTVSSTTALEAMLLDQPVIILNLKDLPETIPYVKSGSAIGVYKPEDLVPTIKKALYDQTVRKELEEKRRKFVYEYACETDGKASKRVADLIEKMI